MSSEPQPPWHLVARIAALRAADTWQGQPHRDRIAILGRGIDCLHFVGLILTEARILPPFRLPYYKPAWGIGRASNIVERVFAECCDVETLPPNAPPKFGDVAIFAVGQQSNHVGIVLDDGDLWHVRARDVVRPEPIADLQPALQSLIRFREPGFRRRPETLTLEDLRPTA